MISIERGIKDMTEKNICQNPKCSRWDTKDRWNKKQVGINHERHIINLNPKIIVFIIIFAQQVVGMYG